MLECLLSGSLLYMTHPEKSSFYRLRRELPGLILTGILPEELEEGRSLEEKGVQCGLSSGGKHLPGASPAYGRPEGQAVGKLFKRLRP